MEQHVYIIGAKGISFYGGYESFVQKLLEYHKNNDKIKYHIACKANGEGAMDVEGLEGTSEIINGRFSYNNADCFLVKIPDHIGSAQAIFYDLKALKLCCEDIERNNISNPIVYILACRIGPFVRKYVNKIHALGGKVYLNPDGHEWKRAKWSAPIRAYWKKSEKLMVKYSDLIICDSINIEKYIKQEYSSYLPCTTYIAYGAETRKSLLDDNNELIIDWYKKNGLKKKEYYLVVGRFVPENNYETMIREFMKSKSKKDFAIITNVNEKFLNDLEEKLHFKRDQRVKFVGTVYDQELLMKIRENAYGYFHGHEVGGTNPSLLEALGSTDLNLLLDVGFNRECGMDGALYWNKEADNLAGLIDYCDTMKQEEIVSIGEKAKMRIKKAYSWEFITEQYEKVFCENDC